MALLSTRRARAARHRLRRATLRRPLRAARAPRLSAVVPCYNEADGLATLHRRLSASCRTAVGDEYEIILVNDGSADATWSIICQLCQDDPRVVGVDLSRNFGHQHALTAGLSRARGALVYMLDADLQDPPELLEQLLERIHDGADIAYGRRRLRHGESWFKKSTAFVYYRLLDRLSDTPIPLDAGDFRLMTRRSVDHLLAMPEHDRFMRGMTAWIGFRQDPVDYDRDERSTGATSYPLGKMLRLAMTGIIGFSDRPLRMAIHLSLFCAFLAVGILCYAIGSWLLGYAHRGWLSTIGSILFVGAGAFFFIGMLGQYIAQIHRQVQSRPLFIIRELRQHDGKQ